MRKTVIMDSDISTKSTSEKNKDQTITISSTEMKLFDSENYKDIQHSNEIKSYNTHDKKIIASRIEQIKNKKIYVKLFSIIYVDNNDFTSNTNGVFLNINNLQDKTLTKIEKLLDTYDNIKTNKNTNNKWNMLLQSQYNMQNTQHVDDKYTNHEKLFLKRQQSIDTQPITYWGSQNKDRSNSSAEDSLKE